MAKGNYLSAKEYAERTGLAVSTVTKQLREGKLKGVKKGGKWMVPADAAASSAGAPKKTTPQKTASKEPAAAPSPKPAAPKPVSTRDSDKSFSIDEFSRMTFLTPFGVEEWLRKGLLKGTQNDAGDWRIDGGNLALDRVKRLLR